MDVRGRAGAIAGTAGLLPEDVHDRQPLLAHGVLFVSRVRLDNRAELCRELFMSREEQATLADSDILLRSYLRWEEQCVDKAYGDYAFAAWHLDSGRLVAAVDHFASAPLYYASCGENLVAATQLAAVLAHPDVPRDLNVAALGALCVPSSVAGSTPYRAISALPPGHLLVHENGQLRLRRWWRPAGHVRYLEQRDYIDHAASLFEKAVSARLRAVDDIATTMSGGLDSTLVTAAAARLLATRGAGLTAYTCVPDAGLECTVRENWDASDFSYASAVAAMHRGIAHEIVGPQGLCPLDMMPSVHAYSRTPVRNGANHMWLGRISLRAAQSGARVILTGQRGNLSISAAGHGVLEELVWSGQLRAAARSAIGLRRMEDVSIVRTAVSALSAPLLRRVRGAQPSRFSAQTCLNSDFLQQFGEPPGPHDTAPGPNQTRTSRLIHTKVAWSADPLVQWDVEWRDPTSDRRLVEYLVALPLDAFVVDGRYRGLARALGENLIPESVRLRRTRGAQVPELPGIVAAHSIKYQRVLAAAAGSPLLSSICNLQRVGELLDEVTCRPGDGCDASQAAHTVDRVLDIGMFISSHEAAR